MNPVVNHLIQLQELTLIRAEQKIHKHENRVEQLEGAIDDMTGQLTADVRSIFLRLQRRSPIVIVPVSNGICSGCGLKLPISLVQEVRQAPGLTHCPTCTRILYTPYEPVRRLHEAPNRIKPAKPGISRFSSPSLMIPRLSGSKRNEVIRELTDAMHTSGFVDNSDKLYEEALRRETIMSTAVDHGLAFPHVRGIEGGALTLAMGMSSEGIPFDEDNKTLTHLVFFIVIPTAANAFYLKLLAGLTDVLRKAENREKLMAEEEPEKLWKTLIKVTRPAVS